MLVGVSPRWGCTRRAVLTSQARFVQIEQLAWWIAVLFLSTYHLFAIGQDPAMARQTLHWPCAVSAKTIARENAVRWGRRQ